MRPFEFLPLVALLPVLGWPILARRRPGWVAYLPAVAGLLIVAHLLLEGYRWQMWPAYLLTGASLLLSARWWRRPAEENSPPRHWSLTIAGRLGGIVWLGLAALPALLPVPRMPEPSGSFPVGTTTFYFRDETRDEIYTDDPADKRELMVQVWYPAAAGALTDPAAYIADLDVAAPILAERFDLPSFLFNHLNLVKTHAALDAPAATSGGPFPLLVFSHGLRGFRNQNSVLMGELASHGYVVAAIDHTYANIFTVFPDGRVTFYSSNIFPGGEITTEGGRGLVSVWAADVRFVVDRLLALNDDSSGVLGGLLDGEQVGFLGHSTGGGTAVEACGRDERCRAGLALDGWLEPVSEEVAAAGLQRPFMFIGTAEWLGPDNKARGLALYEGASSESYLVTVEGTVHYDYSDLPLFSPLAPAMGLSGSLDGRRAVQVVNDYVLAFFNFTLKGRPSPLLQGDTSSYPEVRFNTNQP
ncbi:MAG: hypothetical protein L0332_31505 [Chloroflexi bacterium]|nr:hypothetical protein [Chloroflexota bacterium]MCI0649665.1 hypothetical protein [Chloroflexota bacterium]MCI0731229.1 hypothetical protein [Chloroflexota bacterium]